MLKPNVRYSFHIKDATVFYSDYDNSINIETEDSCEFDDGLCVTGITPDTMFTMCRNLLGCNAPIQNKIQVRDWHVKSAKEMITALQTFVDNQEANDND